MIQRIVPQSMTDNIPSTASTSDNDKKVETARVQNLDPNLCPICNSMLIGAIANGLTVKVCREHNIVMPCKDV